ncbi:MAG: hypothetical protein LUG16_03905 [Candidatus Gastranaerophilales bacterium]|nr:hypothetical protein [Candidatus Gastranaerophilales bacterium]
MSDDRLFASNNAIGRKYYYINLFILIILFVVTGVLYNYYIFPEVQTEFYQHVADFIYYVILIIYFITFLSLVDRRLYDVFGERDERGYKITSQIIQFIVFFQIVIYLCSLNSQLSVKMPIDGLMVIAYFFDAIFMIIVIAAGFFPGKISSVVVKHPGKTYRY